jgi:hypothetical protein
MTTTQTQRELESDMINSARHTHDYTAAYAADEHNSNDTCEYYTAEFEADTCILEHTVREDVGGVLLYRRAGTLVAFFDYECLTGAVFA